MYDYQTIKLLHRHGDDDYVPMTEGSEHTSATHDPERAWLRGARLFSCTKCADEVVITAPNANVPDDTRGQAE
jgi:hypothetical protein